MPDSANTFWTMESVASSMRTLAVRTVGSTETSRTSALKEVPFPHWLRGFCPKPLDRHKVGFKVSHKSQGVDILVNRRAKEQRQDMQCVRVRKQGGGTCLERCRPRRGFRKILNLDFIHPKLEEWTALLENRTQVVESYSAQG